jgi:hypothetical protein
LRKTTTSRGKRNCIKKRAMMPRGKRRNIKKNDNNIEKEKEEHH